MDGVEIRTGNRSYNIIEIENRNCAIRIIPSKLSNQDLDRITMGRFIIYEP